MRMMPQMGTMRFLARQGQDEVEMPREISAAVQAWVELEAAVLEGVVATAMQLQDFDRLDHLIVVEQAGCRRTVASLWPFPA